MAPKAKMSNARWGGLNFPATPQLDQKNTAQYSAAIDIPENAETILIKSTYSANDSTAPVRLVYIDHAGVESISASDTPANTALDDGGSRYHGELLEFPALGAKQFKIRLDGVPTAARDISLYGACV